MLSLSLSTLAFARAPGTLIRGSESKCVGDKMHKLDYTATAGGSLLDLDGDLGSKLDKVTCDMDHTKLTLSFKHRADATEWVVKVIIADARRRIAPPDTPVSIPDDESHRLTRLTRMCAHSSTTSPTTSSWAARTGTARCRTAAPTSCAA